MVNLSLLKTAALLATVLPSTSASTYYALSDNYSGSTFFAKWNFWAQSDPTHGYVKYMTKANGVKAHLLSAAAGKPAFIGVDHKHVLNPSGTGRQSIRIETQKKYTHGLFILDLAHMPGGICGTWPSL
jgi:hypothetical protein